MGGKEVPTCIQRVLEKKESNLGVESLLNLNIYHIGFQISFWEILFCFSSGVLK